MRSIRSVDWPRFAAHPTGRYRIAAALLAFGAGLAVLLLAAELFPYHSVNHDEGVYLQQAAMLLEGRLFLTPRSAALREAVHPWFFVASERGLYPKYSPVPAALFAVGKLAGGYRLALGAIAAANVALVYGVTAAAFDRRTGLVAAAITAAAPLFLLTSAVFLPYAPTTALNLLFALAYVRSTRRRDARYAVLAGVAIGLAFFARPFTAVLFAAPFVVHATWRVVRAIPGRPGVAARYGLIAAVGTAFVGVTLAYNALVTESPLLFPYEAFAPRDGIGFGQRAILGHELVYTPRLALSANAVVLWTFATRWFTAGVIGTAVAFLGLSVVAVRVRLSGIDPTEELSARQLQLVLAGIVVSVAAGNVLFWGNRNVLADLWAPGDGLISVFGPLYHFDLLAPTAAFASHGVVSGWTALRDRWPRMSTVTRVAIALLVLGALPAVAVAQADVLAPPVLRNAAYTAKFEEAYAPFQAGGPPNALVFLPPTYGEWRNHPFQWLRNGPGFDGPAVYAVSRHPAADFAVLAAYPHREYYRYRYHGEWTPDPFRRVIPVLERLERHEGASLTARTTVAVPERIVAVSVALSNGATVRRHDYVAEPPRALTIEWTLGRDGAWLDHPRLRPGGAAGGSVVPIDGPDEVVLTITITEPGGGTLTYREAVLVRPVPGGVAVLWPPASSACPLVTDCGLAGTYVPDRPDTRPTGIAMNTTIVEGRP